MIYSFMGGRCGNQLFRYAFARALQKPNEEIILDFRRIVNHRESGILDYHNNLKDFNISNKVKFVNEEKPFIPDVSQSARFCRLYIEYCKKMKDEDKIFLLEKRMEPIFRKHHVYEKLEYIKYPEYKGDKYILGLAGDSRYFNKIRKTLVRELTPKYPVLKKNENLLKTINETESVCVSLRRWRQDKNESVEEFGVCGRKYYKKAIKIIGELLSNYQLIVFSDDILWAKNNFDFPKNTVFETDNNPIWEKLRLMYSCKHFIIPNSTFAWWAQYLSQNSSKIVISPDRWLNRGVYTNTMIESSFIKIKSDECDTMVFYK